MKRFFLDANILIDMLLNRSINQTDAFKLTETIGEGNIYMSALSVHIAFYTLKIKPNTDLHRKITNFLSFINVLPLEDVHIKKALKVSYKDFEDLLQFCCASEHCDVIITRDGKDFEKIKKLLLSNIVIINSYNEFKELNK